MSEISIGTYNAGATPAEAATAWDAAKVIMGGTNKANAIDKVNDYFGNAGNTNSLENFNGDATTGWTFTMGGVDFKLSTDGKLSYKGSDGKFKDFGVNVADGLTSSEVLMFTTILDKNNIVASTHTSGGLFDKMIRAIANQMNNMFLDIMSMSTVLSSGSGMRGIIDRKSTRLNSSH